LKSRIRIKIVESWVKVKIKVRNWDQDRKPVRDRGSLDNGIEIEERDWNKD
jgi:hypothetical protein